MKTAIKLSLILLFFSCLEPEEEIKPDQQQDILYYQYEDYILKVDYNKSFYDPGQSSKIAEAFELIQKPTYGELMTLHGNKGNITFLDRITREHNYFSLRSVISKLDSCKGYEPGTWMIKIDLK